MRRLAPPETIDVKMINIPYLDTKVKGKEEKQEHAINDTEW